jgi:hypothetical protein
MERIVISLMYEKGSLIIILCFKIWGYGTLPLHF